jgi:hypothetical protein
MVKLKSKFLLFFILLCIGAPALYAKCSFKTASDFEFSFWGMLRPETFFGKNISLLNNNNPNDMLWYNRHTLDVNFNILYGQECYGCPVVEFMSTFRNKAIWGVPTSIASTTDATVKLLDTVFGEHRHTLPRLFPWMRELWMEFSINEALDLDFANVHRFKIGAFPFELGRGIALGSAYAVGPDILGFYNESIIDQFAFGAKFSGTIINCLNYDLYGAILHNKSSSLSDTAEKVLGQQFGMRDFPQRGFGKVNYLVASRFNWLVFDTPKAGRLSVEPYALYNNDPLQEVEFREDASSKLATFGIASEFITPCFEFGFDCAFNVGSQRVKGWDRNKAKAENNGGLFAQVNSNVVDQDGNKIPFIPGSPAQKIINCAPQDASQNGRQIGVFPDGVGYLIGPITLFNDARRFRNPYTNSFQGMMCVGDAGWWIYKKELQIAVTAGYTTGDRDPNSEVIDGDFAGFIGLQELYSGKRVKSAFVLGGAGKLQRPLSGPENDFSLNEFPQTINGFTNLALVGAGLHWRPVSPSRRVYINPNVLAFWEPVPGKKFDPIKGEELQQSSRSFMGIEANLFGSLYFFDNLKFYFVGSAFFPGGHFTDIKGKPLNEEQQKVLDRLDVNADFLSEIPNIGDNIAWTINIGLELTF